MKGLRGTFSRLAAVVVLGLLVTGPSPGEVGGCGDASTVADAPGFCLQSRALMCSRHEARGEISADEKRECLQRVEDVCGRIHDWPMDCAEPPTQRQADACIEQLKLSSNLGKDVRTIAACEVCGAYPRAPLDELEEMPMETDAGMGGTPDASVPDDGGTTMVEDGGISDAAEPLDGGGA